MRVVVIGAGVVGESVAYHAADAGAEVVVVDGGRDGQATAAGAGIVFPYAGAVPAGWEPLVPPALAHWSEVIDPYAERAGAAAVGILDVAVDGPELRAVPDVLSAMRSANDGALPAEQWLETGEPARLFPALRADLAGYRLPGVRRVDGRRLRDLFLGWAVERGAVRRTGIAALAAASASGPGAGSVAGPGARSGGGTRVSLDGEPLDADAIVVAAGAWSAAVCEPLGARLPVRPERGQILHVDLPGVDTTNWPMVRYAGRYLLAFPGGRVVSGATHEPEAGFDFRVTADGAYRLLAEALEPAPGLADGTVVEVRVGFRPRATDGLPLLGRLARHPDVVVATGLGANGLTFGPSVGASAAQLALGRTPEIDLSAFRPDR